MAEENIDVRVRLRDRLRFSRDTRRAAEDVDQIADSQGRLREAQRRSTQASDQQHKAFIRLTKGSRLLQNRNGFLARGFRFLSTRIGAVSIAGALVGNTLVSIGAGAISLTASIAPVSGALVAMPFLLGAVAQGFSVFGLAVGDLKAGVGDLNAPLDDSTKAFKRLSKQGQDFARYVHSDLKPAFLGIQKTAQRGLFPGIQEGFKYALKNLPVVKRLVGLTAEALGDLSKKAGQAFGSADWGRDIETIGTRNVTILNKLAGAGGNVADTLRHIWVVAGPTLILLSDDLEKLTGSLEGSAKAGRENGKLAGFFERGRSKLWEVSHILSDVVMILYHVGRASRASGDTMLGSIGRVLERWRAWTASIEGQRSMRDFFERSRVQLTKLTRFLGDQAKIWSNPNLSLGQKIQASIRRMRLGEALAAALKEALPIMAESATAMAPVLLEAFIRGFMQANLGGKLVIVAFFGWKLALPFVAAIGSSIAGQFVSAYLGRMAASRAAMAAAGAAGAAATPVGPPMPFTAGAGGAVAPAVTGAAGGVAGGGALAFLKRWGGRLLKFVGGRVVLPLAIAMTVVQVLDLFGLRKPLRDVRNLIIRGIGGAFTSAWRWAVIQANRAGNWIVTRWNRVVNWFGGLPARFAAIGMRLFNWIRTGAFLNIFTLLPRIWARVMTWIVNRARQAGSWVIRAFWNVVNWFRLLPGRLHALGGRMFYWTQRAAINARNWIVNAFWDVVNWFRGLPGRIGNAASGMWNGIVDSFRAAVNWIIAAWNNLSLTIGGGTIYLPFGRRIVLPTMTLNTPNIPFLAEGGTIAGAGSAIVGEAGPELINLPTGASVMPLPSISPQAEPIDWRSLPPIEIINKIFLDGEQIAESIGETIEDRMART